MSGPLAGLRVVELGGAGPVPFAAMLLADLGADVVRIDRPAAAGERFPGQIYRSRRSVALDLRRPAGRDAALALVTRADATLEGFRPGVCERLGLGPGDCRAVCARLVYGRCSGWGRDGPLHDAPGHDVNYTAVAGVLGRMGPAGHPPVPPLNLVGDFGGAGMLLAVGVIAGLHHAARTGEGQVVDTSILNGAALLLTNAHGSHWSGPPAERGANLTDGGAPFYGVYTAADGRYVAVGAIEPPFYSALLAALDLPPEWAGSQMDRSTWPAVRAAMAAAFRQRTRDEWCARLEGTDACVSPVLDSGEPADHPQVSAAGTFTTVDGVLQPWAMPSFDRTPVATPTNPGRIGADTTTVLGEAGVIPERIAALLAEGTAADGSAP